MLFRSTQNASPAQAERIVTSLVLFLKKKHRLELLGKILSEYRMLLLKRNALEDIQVTSAAPLSPEMKRMVRETLHAPKNAAVIERTDPSMLGGVVVKYKDMLLDASVGRTLHRLKEALLR